MSRFEIPITEPISLYVRSIIHDICMYVYTCTCTVQYQICRGVGDSPILSYPISRVCNYVQYIHVQVLTDSRLFWSLTKYVGHSLEYDMYVRMLIYICWLDHVQSHPPAGAQDLAFYYVGQGLLIFQTAPPHMPLGESLASPIILYSSYFTCKDMLDIYGNEQFGTPTSSMFASLKITIFLN